MLYDQFCNFELAPALEILAIAQKPVHFFAKSLSPVRSEEGLAVLPDISIDHLDISEYDSLLLPGAADIRKAIENNDILDFVRKFDGMPIGAISIAPLLLLKAGLLDSKPFMAGVNPEELTKEGFSAESLALMKGWEDNLNDPVDAGYIRAGNIVTSVSYNFVRWALAFGRMLGISISPKTFGI